MRECVRCQAEMLDAKFVDVMNSAPTAVVVTVGAMYRHLGATSCAVCPKCGEISLYIEDLSRINRYAAGEQKWWKKEPPEKK